MSQENVEIVRRYFEVFNAGGLDATAKFRHPDVEVVDPPTLPDSDSHVGEVNARKAVESYLEIGWDGQFRNPRFWEAGDEVLAVWEFKIVTPHGGGMSVEGVIAQLFALDDEGKIRRIRQFMSEKEGRRAAGLSE